MYLSATTNHRSLSTALLHLTRLGEVKNEKWDPNLQAQCKPNLIYAYGTPMASQCL